MFPSSVLTNTYSLVLKRLRPSRFLPSIMVLWRTIVTVMGLVKTYTAVNNLRKFIRNPTMRQVPSTRWRPRLPRFRRGRSFPRSGVLVRVPKMYIY